MDRDLALQIITKLTALVTAVETIAVNTTPTPEPEQPAETNTRAKK